MHLGSAAGGRNGGGQESVGLLTGARGAADNLAKRKALTMTEAEFAEWENRQWTRAVYKARRAQGHRAHVAIDWARQDVAEVLRAASNDRTKAYGYLLIRWPSIDPTYWERLLVVAKAMAAAQPKVTRYVAEAPGYGPYLVDVEEGQDLDGTVTARDVETGDVLRLNGWHWTFDEAAEQPAGGAL